MRMMGEIPPRLYRLVNARKRSREMFLKKRIMVLAGRHRCVSCDMEDMGSSVDSLLKAFLALDADGRP